ncbi:MULTISPECIES: spore coat protein [unclassified Psychrobacillus]|uniref:spore coat protein n=1 Tax=unclassified Psychrobacillus TaxID=2636677 RepID=UPI0024979E01|nr:spore coat protein [Psychrobacillus sp. NEAU-3TGS]MDI2588885.1 spore coat protein [Psychrobacillus sp. NEAU-3TGS]
MSELPKKTNAIPNKVIDLLVSDTLRKNGINLDDAKGKLSSDQKQMLKELVEELTTQVNEFVDKTTSPKKGNK